MPRVVSHGPLVAGQFASIPEEFDRHIAHGDTDGPCPHHKE